ncbi:50S ribosomal protein L4 [Candidatus Gracilibacteria bacterium]|nr:50S ribosomal protein L4 [Candidatus Gracilibacteria bacterium]
MTYSVDIYNKDGKVVSKFDLNESVFDDSLINENLIHEYYLLQISNARNSIANTKGVGEVAGSNKKLYKQKGTGNARAGQRRSPIRKGGGVAFGPRSERNFSKTMNKKTRRLAINGLLTIKARDNQIIGLDEFDYKEIKTKNAESVLKNIGVDSQKVLLVLDQKDGILEKSFKNLKNVKYILADYLNPQDLMSFEKIMFLKAALEKINK